MRMCYFEVPNVSTSEVELPAILPVVPNPGCVAIELFHEHEDQRNLRIEKAAPSETGIVMEYWNKGILYEVNIATPLPPHCFIYIELWEKKEEGGDPFSHDRGLFAWNGFDYESVPSAMRIEFDVIRRISLDM